MDTIKNRELEQKGIGFAILLLTVGIIWLLYSINLISASGINIALSLWPLALVAIGADLLMRKQSPRISIYIVLAIAAVVILAALIAPRLGIGVLNTTSDTYAEQLTNAESATINLHPGIGSVNVRALETENVLFNADATYIGDVRFDVQGTSQRHIDFGQSEVSTTGWFSTDEDLYWNIGLTPHIPLQLAVNTGVGAANLDFTDLNLTSLTLTGGVGQVNLILPTQDTSYSVTVTGGVGDFDIRIPDNADVDLTITGGVGELQINVPDDAAVSVRVASGLGGIHVPSWLQGIDSGTDEQIWQSSNFETATQRINIYVQSGLGGLTIR